MPKGRSFPTTRTYSPTRRTASGLSSPCAQLPSQLQTVREMAEAQRPPRNLNQIPRTRTTGRAKTKATAPRCDFSWGLPPFRGYQKLFVMKMPMKMRKRQSVNFYRHFWCKSGAKLFTIIRKAPILSALFYKMAGTVGKIEPFSTS